MSLILNANCSPSEATILRQEWQKSASRVAVRQTPLGVVSQTAESSPFSRRFNSRSTASRMKPARPYVPTNASIRSSASGDSRTGTRVMFSGGRPIGRAVAGIIASGKKTAPFSIASVNGTVYINGTLYGGKA